LSAAGSALLPSSVTTLPSPAPVRWESTAPHAAEKQSPPAQSISVIVPAFSSTDFSLCPPNPHQD
jgi:hypothetical protein